MPLMNLLRGGLVEAGETKKKLGQEMIFSFRGKDGHGIQNPKDRRQFGVLYGKI